MASVQLERGYVRVANRLDEALCTADFTLTQLKVVRMLIRLTWGWRQFSVRVAMGDLATYCGMNDSGGFRRDFRKLIENGVIIEEERAHGRTPAAYSFNKDFEQWGIYSVPLARLEKLFSERPESLNRVTPSSQPKRPAFDLPDDEAEPGPEDRSQTPPSLSIEEGSEGAKKTAVSMEQGSRLHGVSQTPSKSIFDETLQRWKDRKDISTVVSTDHCTNTSNNVVPAEPAPETAAAADSKAHEYSVALAVAANDAISRKWGEQPSKVLRFSTGAQLATDLLNRGVPIDLAEHVIARVVEQSKLTKPPGSLEYFRDAIAEAFEHAQEAATIAAASKRVHQAEPTPIAATLSKSVDLHARREAYDHARRIAGVAWGKDPANAVAYSAIVASANERYAEFIGVKWGQRSRDELVISECATAASFPDFENWKQERDPPRAPEQTRTE